MKMTSEWVMILDEVDQLNDLILNSDVHRQLVDATESVYSNPSLVQKITEFNKTKDLYEDVQRFGKYHPDYTQIMKLIRTQKRELDMDETISALKVAENEFQDLLDEIGIIIGKTISEAVKVPVSNPFFQTDTGCGGSCGTGGGCSCSA
ncbi:YlbF family regulator [Kurthia gibsonii]|uniref:YlbF family regulator n=1 Tax=Kurthia gibsonii TaxID=33946 RepID=UPI002DB6F7C7|nr:YlbF family regulator [Kurthia gibsonii]MEB6111836.1 YlbF family regulator [Kurthia gibsonii]